MAKFEEHCEDCVKELGEPFKEVHSWLDELASPLGGCSHRRERHHLEGIEKIRSMWGDKAAEAGKIHILKDLFFWGEVPSKDEYDDVELAYFSAMGSMFHG